MENIDTDAQKTHIFAIEKIEILNRNTYLMILSRPLSFGFI